MCLATLWLNGANIFNVLSVNISARRSYEEISFSTVCCHVLQNSSLSKLKNFATASYELMCSFDVLKLGSSTNTSHTFLY